MAPHAHETVLYDVVDCQIAKLLTDPPLGPPTYGPLIPAPGIKTLTVSPAFKKDLLRGGGRLVDVRSKMTEQNFTFTFAKLQLDLEAILFGGTVTDSGATPNTKTTYDLLGDDKPSFFKIEAQCIGVDDLTGDCHITFYKAIADAESLGFADETHHVMSCGASAVPRIADKKWRTTVLNETAVAIA